MDCNKEEAVRAREIAERKFNAKDFAAAKKFALKAQNLYPALDGVSQMISTMDVYLSAEVNIYGEKDWYAILCVNASADEETVKKQYRKLALQLHPDKNKSIGAEGAFQLISEAWSVLSDKSRKLIYDQRRNVKGHQQKASQSHKDHSIHGASNGFYNFANTSATTRVRKSNTGGGRSTAQTQTRSANPNTFWTSCNRCKMQYEYLRVYLNHNLLCPNCKEPFLAVEMGVPVNGSSCSVSWSSSQQHQQNSNHNSAVKNASGAGRNSSKFAGNTGFQHGVDQDSYNSTNFHWGPFSRTTGAASANASSAAAAQAVNMVHQTYEKVKREREEAQASARREESLQRRNHASKRTLSTYGFTSVGAGGNTSERDRQAKKRRTFGDDAGTDSGGIGTEQVAHGTGKTIGSIPGAKVPYNLCREFSQFDIRTMLMEKAKVGIRKKAEEWNSAVAAKLAEKKKTKKKQKREVNDNGSSAANGDGSDQDKNASDQVPANRSSSDDPSSDAEKEAPGPLTIDVPDPDFHDFDKDRSERSFEGDQIWATYDNEDGMPRFYVFVQKVLSLKPFKIRMSNLSSKSNSEFGPLNWVTSGFVKTCGDFRVGRYVVNDTINIFSHRVRWEKGPRGVLKIVPKKGDTWALYRNWAPDWNEHTPDDVIYKYDMVEVLDDYTEEQGVSVTPLVKVAGFKTVFHRHMDPEEVRRIPREEMFRFSHQVPSYVLTGEEAHNAPKGCRELDPAATPLELLQVITDVKEEDAETSKEKPVS